MRGVTGEEDTPRPPARCHVGLRLSGEPGIGKSRLLSEVERIAGERATPVAWGRAVEAEGAPPFWPWRHVLRARAIRPEPDAAAADAELLPLISRLSPDPDELESGSGPAPLIALGVGDERFGVFDAVARLLVAAAAPRGLVVLLDDVHWADPPSLRLLSHVAHEWHLARGLLVATYRTVTGGRDDPLRRAVGEIARLEGTTRMELRGLSPEDVAIHLAAVSGRRMEPHAIRALHERTSGNPFFITEFGRLLDAETERGRRPFDTARDVPQGVRDVIARRMTRLSRPCQEALEVASVVGAQPAPDIVAAVLPCAVTEVLDRFDEAVDSGLLTRPEREVGYAFTHALVRDALYSELATGRRIRLHETIARQLEASGRAARDSRMSELAYHWLQAAPAGHAAHAGEVAEQAGDAAMRQLAYEEAARLYESAAAALVSEGEPGPRRTRLLLAAARARFLAGELERATALCRDAALIARTHGASELLADAALVIEGVGDTATSTLIAGLCTEALSLLPADALHRRSRLLAQLVSAKVYLGDYEQLDELSAEALDGAERSGDADTLAAALRARHIAFSSASGAGQRMQVAERMLALAGAANRPVAEMWARLWRFDACIQMGDFDAAALEVDAMARLGESMHQPLARWHLSNCRFAMAFARGDFTAAHREADIAAELTTAAGELAAVRVHMQRAFIAIFTGEDSSATVAAINASVASVTQQRLPTWLLMPRVILSMLALAEGRDAEAARNYDDLPPPDTWQLMPPTYLISRTHRATIAAGLGRVEEAGRLYRELLPFAEHFSTSGAGTIACFGSIEHYLGMLARTMGRFDGALQHLERALNKHVGAGLRPFAAETRYQLALTQHRRDRAGDVGRSLALLTESAADAEHFGLRPLARRVTELREALRTATRRGQVITSREMEIARFVAEGLTSREIAEALHISARTADNHVQHILDKLGLRSRSQIAAWVARRSS
ncbi:MAG: hypothetical protein E6J45_07785 [Chloroflexi bacterium]|nr:MAG: hypothetical protein E6J45_07785 [Chloroflexota bacterium]